MRLILFLMLSGFSSFSKAVTDYNISAHIGERQNESSQVSFYASQNLSHNTTRILNENVFFGIGLGFGVGDDEVDSLDLNGFIFPVVRIAEFFFSVDSLNHETFKFYLSPEIEYNYEKLVHSIHERLNLSVGMCF